MKSILISISAAVVLVGCATPQSPELPTTKVLEVPILAAAYNGNIEAVKKNLAAGTDVKVKGGFADGASLHYAAANGHTEIAELLIHKDADVNAKDEDGGTPLDVAIQFKELETADLLRKHAARPRRNLKSKQRSETLSNHKKRSHASGEGSSFRIYLFKI